MNLDQVFNLVAPIFIYHAADVAYKQDAIKALRQIRKTTTLPLVGNPPKGKPLDELYSWAKDAYDTAFEAVVDEEAEDWDWEFDRGGAKAYKDEHNRQVFAGDAMYQFPLYADAQLLRKRIQDHIDDHCQDGPMDDTDDLD